jgi:hypothetical protein
MPVYIHVLHPKLDPVTSAERRLLDGCCDDLASSSHDLLLLHTAWYIISHTHLRNPNTYPLYKPPPSSSATMLARSSAQLRPVITSANRLDLARFMSSAAKGANPADQLVLVDRQGPVTVLTLNRPKALNALSSPLFVQLNNELDKAAQDDQVKCIVLTGGEKVFAGESRRSVIGRSFKNEGTVVTKLYVCVCLLQPARTSRR